MNYLEAWSLLTSEVIGFKDDCTVAWDEVDEAVAVITAALKRLHDIDTKGSAA